MTDEKVVFEKFIRAIDLYAMVSEGDTILVGLSGGADSVALLSLLLDLRYSIEFDICAAHLNHCLRGSESEKDESFVKELCQQLHIPCLTAKEDVKRRAKISRISIEVAGREARLEFLKRTCEKMKASRLALGHTMNDQAENVLIRLLRGAGMKGLSSMRPLEGKIMRPLLSISREEIESYLRCKGIPFRVDSSNEDMRFTRNRIRYQLIPFLKEEYNPEIVETLARTASLLSEEESFLDSLTTDIMARESMMKKGIVSIPQSLLKSLPPALSRRLIRRSIQWIKKNLRKVTFKDIEKIREILLKAHGNRNVLLPSGIDVKIYRDSITFSASSETDSIDKDFYQTLNIEGVTEVPGSEMAVESTILKREDFKDDLRIGGRRKAFLDFDKTGSHLIVRGIRKGDAFHPFNSPGKKKISDFFIDRKIPREKRGKAFIVASHDHIVWLAGYEIDDQYKIDKHTKKILILQLIKGA